MLNASNFCFFLTFELSRLKIDQPIENTLFFHTFSNSLL